MVQIAPSPEKEPEGRKSVDQIDLINKFLQIHQAESGLSTDYVLSPADANTEDFTRSMIKAAVNAKVILEQGAVKYVEHVEATIEMQEEMHALERAWGKEAFKTWKENKLATAKKEAAIAAQLGKVAHTLISAEPHMVHVLRRNQKANPFAKGAFEGDKISKDEDEGKNTVDKLTTLLGQGGKKV